MKRAGVRLAWLFVAECLLLAPSNLRAQQATSRLEGGVLTIHVERQPSALFWALDEVQRHCVCAIGYEEPRWAWRGDLESVRDERARRAVTTSRRVTLRVSAPVTAPLTREETRAVIATLVAQYEAATSARFLIRGERVFEVVPASFKDTDGRVVRHRPLIDTPVTVDGVPALPSIWFQRLTRAIGAATGRDIRPALFGNHLNLGHPVAFAAAAEPARLALSRLYDAHGVDAVFRLSYSPEMRRFGMGLRTAR